MNSKQRVIVTQNKELFLGVIFTKVEILLSHRQQSEI